MSNEIYVEISRNISGGNLVLRVSVKDPKEISKAVDELSQQFNLLEKNSKLLSIASTATVETLPLGVTPSPIFEGQIPDLPSLENPPQSYKPRDAVVEIMHPKKSNWAKKPRFVSEIQLQLQQLGVRGVTNLQSFDKAVRDLQGQGKLRREMVDGKYAYYAIWSE